MSGRKISFVICQHITGLFFRYCMAAMGCNNFIALHKDCVVACCRLNFNASLVWCFYSFRVSVCDNISRSINFFNYVCCQYRCWELRKAEVISVHILSFFKTACIIFDACLFRISIVWDILHFKNKLVFSFKLSMALSMAICMLFGKSTTLVTIHITQQLVDVIFLVLRW